jgi:hypothetical protein
MRHFILIFTILVSSKTIGQTLNQGDLMEIVRLAYEQDKLPRELVCNLDTVFNRSFPDPFIVIKSDKNKGIVRQYGNLGEVEKIMVWNNEDIFLYNITYWITPLETSRKRDFAYIRYERTTYGQRHGITAKCYKGEIKGKFNGENWKLLKSKFVGSDCNFSHWGAGK